MSRKIVSKLKKPFQERTSHPKLMCLLDNGTQWKLVYLFIYLFSFYGQVLDFIFGHLEGKINMVMVVFLYYWVQGAKSKTPCLKDTNQSLVIRDMPFINVFITIKHGSCQFTYLLGYISCSSCLRFLAIQRLVILRNTNFELGTQESPLT